MFESITNKIKAVWNNKWVRYALFLLILAAAIWFLWYVFMNKRLGRTSAGRVYTVPESAIAVAVDNSHFYAICAGSVSKYNRKSGKKLAGQAFSFKDLQGGKIVNGDLVLFRPKELIWTDPQTLEPVDTMDLSFIKGKIVWIDWILNNWWVCETGKHAKDTKIYCFDGEWNPLGFWTLPKAMIADIRDLEVNGGAIFGEYICITAGDSHELYILDIPADTVAANLLRKVQMCFDGHGFSFERGKGVIYVWGLRTDEGTIVRCTVDLDSPLV